MDDHWLPHYMRYVNCRTTMVTHLARLNKVVAPEAFDSLVDLVQVGQSVEDCQQRFRRGEPIEDIARDLLAVSRLPQRQHLSKQQPVSSSSSAPAPAGSDEDDESLYDGMN